MSKPIHRSSIACIAIVMLSITSGIASAQTADQSFNTIPQQVKASAETKASTKSTTVSNNAMNKMDSASNKAFNGFTGLFKKKAHKNKNPKTDSTGVHPADSTAVPPKSSFRTGGRYFPHLLMPVQGIPADAGVAYIPRNSRRPATKAMTEIAHSQSV